MHVEMDEWMDDKQEHLWTKKKQKCKKAEMMMHAEEYKTQNDIFMGQHFDQAAFFIFNI